MWFVWLGWMFGKKLNDDAHIFNSNWILSSTKNPVSGQYDTLCLLICY